MSLLRLERICASYGKATVLREIDLEVPRGGVVALIGANGAGKTTTLRTISKLLTPSAGRLWFDGEDITGLRPDQVVARGIAHCPEERQLFPRMTVLDNLEMGAYLHRGPLGPRLRRVYDLFPRVAERRHQQAGSLSGGEQQMVAVGRALMSAPRLILFDEPSLGLSPLMAQEVARAIRALHAEGITVLLVEQNVQMAFRLASLGYILENGVVAHRGPTAELLASEQVRRAYLGG
jgi:branched-chain amino acid transport system ATP-binding protein